MKLTNDTVASLPDTVQRPQYDRATLRPGIVHIGLGNFHRAHQAWYLHRLMQMGRALDWAIIGASVRANDIAMHDKLKTQDCLTTLIELDPAGTSAEVIGSMIDYVPIEDGNGPLINALTNPAIRIASLTVTESGYFVDSATGALDLGHPDLQFDVANPAKPSTVFGAIVAALKIRRAAGSGPFTVQSCDNLQGNGNITRQAVVGLAKQTDPKLAVWIDETVSFPNSMVDCIVPATGPTEIARAQALGIEDMAPVTHENYRQWVMEDDFCAGRPDWDLVGATLTETVHDHEKMKMRVLNAGHQVVANVGELLSVETIADSLKHSLIAAFFHKVQHEEIAPYVKPVPGMSPSNYVALIEKRFANPYILDTTRRVAFDGSSRHPGFVLPILRDALEAGGEIQGLALVEALWARMCAGTRQDGTEIAPNDPQWGSLVKTALAARDDPRCWLKQQQIYGDLDQNALFVSAFEVWLSEIWENGCEAALTKYTGQTAVK
ncbi:mannitol dehydrogenase family protein [Cognatishimia sp. WU-CL00825]|uniref:mannitol dehydrogenase family protein n=1 Tax=Cognatishimia sp. WU-CL00825 TaxID=3127658 RepID=UPI00310B71F9